MPSSLSTGLLNCLRNGSFLRTGTRGITTFIRTKETNIKAVSSTNRFLFKRKSELLTIPGCVRLLATGSSSKGILRQKLGSILRILFLVTGGAVWGLPAILYIGFKSGLVKIETDEQDELESGRHDERIFSVFDVSQDDEHESRAREINDKSSALMKVWNKLKLEDGVLRMFGDPVDLIGYHKKYSASNDIDKDHVFGLEDNRKNSNTAIRDLEIVDEQKLDGSKEKYSSGILEWCVACVVAGPKLTGILELEFSKVKEEWIPVSLHLEGIQKTGDVICNVSGPLPNGITRFVRLSND